MSLIEALGGKHAQPVSEKTRLNLKLLLRAIGPPPFTIFAAPNKNHNLSLAAYKKKHFHLSNIAALISAGVVHLVHVDKSPSFFLFMKTLA